MDLIEEKPKGRFAKGRSGNANGRPKGARNKTTLAVEQLLAGQSEALTAKVVERALAGDMVAMRLCMERIAPVRKDRCVDFELPDVKTPGDVTVALGSILKAVSAGQMTPAEGETVGRLLDLHRLAMATLGFHERVATLEEFAEKFRADLG